ncbi:MAG: FGGY family carbohydrate kinase, partial [Patescibacteria group bacterium]
EIVGKSKELIRQAVKESGLKPDQIHSFGITNQRETTILWNKKTGKPVYPAIVWQDQRTYDYCRSLLKDHQRTIMSKTGLVIDSYFSASKIRWIFDNVEGVKEQAELGNIAFGTVDSWILYNLCDDHPHITDNTNASRTLLFNIRTMKWDKELMDIFGVPANILPETKYSDSKFCNLSKDILGHALPIHAVCGDQQSSMYAAGIGIGNTKVTFGTGTFIMQVIGRDFELHEPFFTTIVPDSGHPLYAVEGKVERYGREVVAVLDDPDELDRTLHAFASDVDLVLHDLPLKPKELVIDGGVIRDGKLRTMQENVSGIPVREQTIFDGTSLGIAKLLKSC